MSKVFPRGSTVLVLLVLLSVLTLTASADDSDHDHIGQFGPVDLVEMVFFPYLPHGDTIDSTGLWYGSITVQNLEARDVRIWVFRDAGFVPDKALGTYVLPPNGAITLSSSALGLEEPGSPLVVAGVFRMIWDTPGAALDHAIAQVCDNIPGDQTDYDAWQYSCKPSIAAVARISAPGPMAGATNNRTTREHLSVDGYNAIPAQDVSWGSQSAFCGAVAYRWDDSCSGIGTYEPLGYGIGFVFDGHSYLPIVQTNSGWNTEIRISNIDPSIWAAQVNVTLITGNQSGHGSREDQQITFEATLRPGESWAIDLRQYGIPDGWVGSAHITSNAGVVAYAARVKPSEDMLMINVAAPSAWATTSPGTEFQSQNDNTADYAQTRQKPFEMFVPLVFRDYHGWNTGISILNIDEAPTRVAVTWYDQGGTTRGVDALTIPAKGQRYVYLPGSSDPGVGAHLGWVGSVTLSANAPFHAVVDQVKYETSEAMSYMATAAGAWASNSTDHPIPAADSLALPLLQKGWADGSGDTSGIQLFNPDVQHSVDVEISFYSPVGDLIPPTTAVPIRTTIRPRGHYTLYTLDSSVMIPNSTGTAHVRVVGGKGRVYGVSNLVNYDVSGDGSTAFSLVNSYGQYRFPASQTELP